jgi:GNAT superfamily N-acetyltransferase
VTETPTTPAEPPDSVPRKRPRGFETVGDMVRSLALVLVVVAVVVLLTVRDEPQQQSAPVDFTAQLATARDQATYDVLAPVGLGRGWRATSARGSTDGNAVTWHLGLVTPSEAYAAVEQSDGQRPTFVDQFASGSKRAGTVTIAGVTWTRLAGGAPEPRALQRTSGEATTLVAGSASWAELRRLATSLRAGWAGSVGSVGSVGSALLGLGSDGGGDAGASPVEPLLADRRQRLAALPERQRLLERRTPGLQPADHLGELLTGLFVGRSVLIMRALILVGGLRGRLVGHGRHLRVVGVPALHPPARRATTYDAVEITRLRGVMLASMGVDVESDPGWWARCERALGEQLAGRTFAAYVVDAPAGGLAACGAGWVLQRLPSPGSAGVAGLLGNMCTDPAHRRRGHARAVLVGLLGWFTEQGVRRVDLTATAEGRGLYEAVGFSEPSWPFLSWFPPGA